MKKIALAIIISVLPAMAFAAEPVAKSSKKGTDTKASDGKASNAKTSDAKSSAKPCAEYGAGFVRLEGSSTCVKVSGYVRFQAGRSR